MSEWRWVEIYTTFLKITGELEGPADRRLTDPVPAVLVGSGLWLAGLVVLVPVALLAGGTPSVAAIVWGVVAAVGGTVGLLVYLRALAVGPMGVVAPLSAVVGAGLPLLVGLLTGEHRTIPQRRTQRWQRQTR